MIFAIAIPFSVVLAWVSIYCVLVALAMICKGAWFLLTYPFRTRRPPLPYLLTEAQRATHLDPWTDPLLSPRLITLAPMKHLVAPPADRLRISHE